jgi:putative exosortase-associated protein (TIGR04073 family)
MRIYWWIMTGLMLFPWILALVPPVVAAYPRVFLKEHRRRHLRWVRTVMLVTVLSTATVAFAGEPIATPGDRLRGGVRDLTTGWTAFFHTVAAETVEHGPATGVVVGSLEGTNQALQQTLRGAYETTSFFLPIPRPQPTASEPGTLLEVRF